MSSETTDAQQSFNDRSNGRDSFVFYRSFKESLNDLSDKDKLTVYEAISDYALDKQEPNLEGFPRALFKLIKPQLEANWKRFENGCKGADYGKKGGNPKFVKGKSNPYYNNPKDNPKDNPKITPNVNDNVNVNDNEKEKRTTFVAPSFDDFKKYFIENGYDAELANRVFKSYDVAGWKDSRGKQIKNWKQKCLQVWFKPENKTYSSEPIKKGLTTWKAG